MNWRTILSEKHLNLTLGIIILSAYIIYYILIESFEGFKIFGYSVKRLEYLGNIFFILGAILILYNILPKKFFEYLSGSRKSVSNINNRQVISILAVLTVIGLFLRIHDLGSKAFWMDETIQTYAAIGLIKEGIPVMPSGMIYSRAFLDTLLIAQSLKIFGVSEFAARLPSALFGVLTIPLIFLAGKELGNKRVGIIAAFLLTFSAYENIWNHDARMYSQLQFFYLLTSYLFYIFIKSKNWKIIPAIFGSFILGYYSHVQIWIFILIAFLYMVYLYFRNKTYIKSYMLLGVLFSILVISDIFYLKFLAPERIAIWGKIKLYYFITPEHLTLIAIIFISGIIFLISKNYNFYKKENNFFLLMSFFFPLLIITSYPWMAHRYAFFIYPFLVLIVSKILDYSIIQNGLDNEMNKIFTNLKSKIIIPQNIKILINILIISLIVSELTYNFNEIIYEQEPNNGTGISLKSTNFIKTNLDNDDKVISPEGLVTLFYIGKSDYLIRKSGFVNEKNGIDQYSGSVILKSHDSFMDVVQSEKGWVIALRRDLVEPRIDQRVIDHIRNNMTYYPEASDEITEVYSWGKVQ